MLQFYNMPRLFNFDIPAGLSDRFFKLFGFTSLQEGDGVLRSNNIFTPRSRKISLINNSLFVLWQDLYNSFTFARRDSWQQYWGTLPFSPHTGANFWPGSGFSAFVHVNAPRLRAGLDLLLDPPEFLGPEILSNPDFIPNLDPWQVDDDFNDFSLSDGVLTVFRNDQFSSIDIQFGLSDNDIQLDPGNYRLLIRAKYPATTQEVFSNPIISFSVGRAGDDRFSGGFQANEMILDNNFHNYIKDFQLPGSGGLVDAFVDFIFESNNTDPSFSIEKVSLRKFL